MNCPYCAEEIKESAIVCRHCNRDLSFLQIFEKRMSAVERSLKDVQQPGSAISKTPHESENWVQQQKVTRVLLVLVGTMMTLLIYTFGLLYHRSVPVPSKSSTAIMLLAPFPLALLLIVFYDLYQRTSEYVCIGLSQGVVMWFAAMARARIVWSKDSWLKLAEARMDALLLYLLIGTLMFLSIGLLRRSRRRQKLDEEAGKSVGSWQFIWEHILPPLLTFVASIATAVLSAVFGHSPK